MSMKKMSEVFDLPLEGDSGFLEDQIGDITEHRGQEGACITMSKAAAHAVNPHDKLVEVLDEIMFDEVCMQEVLGCELYDKAKALLKAIKGE